MVDRGEDDREDGRCDAVGIISKHDRRISKPVAVRSASTRPCFIVSLRAFSFLRDSGVAYWRAAPELTNAAHDSMMSSPVMPSPVDGSVWNEQKY